MCHHTQVVDAMQHGDMITAQDTLERLAEQYPTDRMALRLLSINYLARGDYQRGVPTARRSLDAAPDDP
jgi:Flp pilus assembly protein TadD